MSDEGRTSEHGPEGEAPGDAERDARRAERGARREERHAEREARREERRRAKAEWRASFGEELRERIKDEVRAGVRRSVKKWYVGFGDLGFGAQGDSTEASEVVEHRFATSGMPRVHVNNVSGETEITVGAADEVFVRARKRVHGWSVERARRLLENIDIRFEQEGSDILIEPRLFQQERGWLELFRGGRVAVDLDIRVPRETNVEASTVSGELALTGTRGQTEIKSVSGEVSLSDVQGPLRLRTVSGDVSATGFAGQLEANAVSGSIRFERSRVRAPDVVTVSGDVHIGSVTAGAGAGEGRLKSVSGDIEISLEEADLEVDFRTVSGDAAVEVAARVEKVGRRDRRIVIGSGGTPLRVKTVSGDLTLRRGGDDAQAPEGETGAPQEAMPMGAPSAPRPGPSAEAREILARVARGELGVDEAAAALDASRGS